MPARPSIINRLLQTPRERTPASRGVRGDINVLVTDVVGSAAYLDEHGEGAGSHPQAELAVRVVEEFRGSVISTLADSVVAEFPEPGFAVRAGIEMQRRQTLMNRGRGARDQVLLRVGVNAGPVFRQGRDVHGEALELGALIASHCGPAQILISRGVRESVVLEPDIRCTWVGRVALASTDRKEEIFEVIWTDSARYAEVRTMATEALAHGDLETAGLTTSSIVPPPARPTPAPAAPSPAPAASPPTRDLRSEGGSEIASRYEILGELGSGGMGIVYKARDRETAETVALKALLPEVAADASTMERFKNELRLARRITHKNVCRIHDFVRSDGTAYISMEFVEGETLRRVLDRFGTLSLRKGLQIARQICAGLQEAHRQGIVHRDLKPANVMIDRSGDVKLMDFGIARSLDSTGTTSRGLAIGTPAYMSPEQAEGRSVDPRSDIYSLGLILYEMFTGVAAFRADTPIAIALKHIRERPTAPREIEASVPLYLETAIMRCLEKDPALRFPSVAELDAALNPTAAGAERWEETPSPWPPAPRPRPRFKRTDPLLGVLAVVGILLLLFFDEVLYPASRIRLQVDLAGAQVTARRYLRRLAPDIPAGLSPLGVWIDGRNGDILEPHDPAGAAGDFSWEFRLNTTTPEEGASGTIRVDHEGKLRSFARTTLYGVHDRKLDGDASVYRAEASRLSRDLFDFDTERARPTAETLTRFDSEGNQYAVLGWTAKQRDQRGYRTVTAELWNGAVKSLASSYAHYLAPPAESRPWTDVAGGFMFAIIVAAALVARIIRVGAVDWNLRRPLAAALAIGIWAGGTLLPWTIGLPSVGWTAHVMMGLYLFALSFVVWMAGEATLQQLWPEKVASWLHPLDGARLGTEAALSVVRGTLYGLAFLGVFVPLAALAEAGEWAHLRTWSLAWPHTTAYPAMAFLLGETAISALFVLGPISIPMAFLRGRIQHAWSLLAVTAFVATLVFYPPEVVRFVPTGAQVLFLFLAAAWFALCFYDVDLLGAVVGLVIFTGVVGTLPLTRMNLEGPSASSFALPWLVLLALPAAGLISLRPGASASREARTAPPF